MIYKIYNLSNGIQINTKLLKTLDYKQSKICKNNIYKAKRLPFCQIKIFLLKIFKK